MNHKEPARRKKLANIQRGNEPKERMGCLRIIWALFVFIYILAAVINFIKDLTTPLTDDDIYKKHRTYPASSVTGSGARSTGSGSVMQSVPSYRPPNSWRDDYEVPEDDPEITFDDYDDYEGDEDYD